MTTPPLTNDNSGHNLTNTDILCWRLLIWTIGLATPLLVSLKPRRYIVGEIDIAEATGDLSHIAGRGLSLFLLTLACVAVVRHIGIIYKKDYTNNARPFWLLSLLMAAMPTISSLISGESITSSGILGTIIIYSTTYFLPTPPLNWWIREIRVMILIIFVYGSLAASIIFPSWAWNLDYAAESTTAIIPLRLFGTAEHANTLAPLTVFIWMLGKFPNCRLRGEYFHDVALLLVLLLTQSKTNWLIAVIYILIITLKRIMALDSFKRYLVYIILAVLCSLFAIYLFKFSTFSSRINDMLHDPQILTLTGRLPLWLVAIQMWLDKPWFGQGLDAWSSKAILDYIDLLGWGATHAHNQLLQILSQSGVVGLGVFAIWARYFIKIISNTPNNIRTPFCWLLFFYFSPGFTEVIMQYGLGKASAIRTWLLFVISLILLRDYSQSANAHKNT